MATMGKYSGVYSVNQMYRLYKVSYVTEIYGGEISDYEQGGIIYRTHKFTTTGKDTLDIKFVHPTLPGIDFLIIAGGGSGGMHSTPTATGGGGAGGVLYKALHTFGAGKYNVQVGAGGAAIADNVQSAGENGKDSYIGDFIAIGGGGGGGGLSTTNGKDGGSAGGFGRSNNYHAIALQTDVLEATGYGNQGGSAVVNYTGAGGGGAGSVGENGAASWPGGNGGQGLSFDIEGETKWYAGGGGGGNNSSEFSGMGFHGGGRGVGTTEFYSYTSYPEEINSTTLGWSTPDAIPNTGAGGGAGSYWAQGYFSGSGKGASGIVIIRYQIGVV